MVPDGWIETRLGNVVEVNPRRANNLSPEDQVTFLAMPDVAVGGGIANRQVRDLSEVNNGYTAFREKDVLIAKITPCFENCKGAIATGLTNGYGFGSTEFHVLRATEKCDIHFIYYLTMSHHFRGRGAANMTGSAGQKRVPTDFIRAYHFALPPLIEQHRISQTLFTWDRAIEQASRLISAKTRIKKALMQQLLTGKRRFKEFVKSTVMIDTHFGLVPEDWPYIKMSQVAREVSERNGKRNSIPVLSCTKYDGLVDSLKYFGKQIFSDDTSNYKLVRRGQFAYATNHIEEGSIGLLTHLEAGLVSPMYTAFETNDKVHAPFLYALFKTELYRHIFQVNTNASINRRGSLRWKQFAEIRVALPSLDEQKNIASVLAAVDAEINLLCQRMGRLKEQKRGLMQKLLTGKVRVKV